MANKKRGIQTVLATAGIGTDEQHNAVVPPLYLSTNYSFSAPGVCGTYNYARSGNPTRTNLEKALAEIEGGCGAVATSSGMSALLAVFFLMKQGDTMIAPKDVYGGTFRQINSLEERGYINIAWVDPTNEKELEEAFAQKPKMILVETPSNPQLMLTDFDLITKLAKPHGTLIVADNTFLSPVLQRPLELGADISVHSSTKYLNGHEDVMSGVIICKDQKILEDVSWWVNNLGVSSAPFDSYQTLRGLRTLELRIQRQEKTTGKVIEFLQSHDAVGTIKYPGLADHPGHDIAKKQQDGFGAMLSFELIGNQQQVNNFCSSLEIFTLAQSLGGFESLINHPATMTHGMMTPEARAEAGISDGLVRLSIGLEDADDLIADLKQGLDKSFSSQKAA